MFSDVFMGFGVFLIFRSKGGAKIFGRVAKGGRKISDASLGGAKNFRPSKFSESLGKIMGHVKNLLCK